MFHRKITLKSPTCLRWILPLCLIGLAACSRREEPPASTSNPLTAPAAINSLRSATPAVSAPAIPEAPTAPTGANLEKVAQDAAAFSDMVDSLRKFAGEDIQIHAAPQINTDRIDLDSFIRGKTERDLLQFAEAAQFTSPYAALQVLEYLFRHSPDPRIRMEAAIRFGDTATLFGYLKDRALARECFDHLADLRADSAFLSALPRGKQMDLLYGMHRIACGLELDAAAWMRMATALRKCPLSDRDLSIADAFEADALLRGCRAEDLPRIRALYEAIRARGAYDKAYASKESVDRRLAQSDAELKEIQAQWVELLADERAFQERLRQVDPLPPAERLAELRRLNQVDETP